MGYTFQFRRGTKAQWFMANPTLGAGEPGVEIDAINGNQFKLGDGVTAWNDLAYFSGESNLKAYIDQQIELAGPITPSEQNAIVEQVLSTLELPDLVQVYEQSKA